MADTATQMKRQLGGAGVKKEELDDMGVSKDLDDTGVKKEVLGDVKTEHAEGTADVHDYYANHPQRIDTLLTFPEQVIQMQRVREAAAGGSRHHQRVIREMEFMTRYIRGAQAARCDLCYQRGYMCNQMASLLLIQSMTSLPF